MTETLAENFKVAVIGAGVNGIGSALAILQRFPHCKLTVFSEKFTPDTTGDNVAGLWEPFQCPGVKEEDLNNWCKNTWDLLYKWWRYGYPEIRQLPCYCFSEEEEDLPHWKHIPIGFEQFSKEERLKMNPRFKSGYKFQTIIARPSAFLPRLMQRIKERGGEFVKRKIKSLDELSNFDVLVNCTGIGAYDLVNDTNVFPIRGQVLRVEAPTVSHVFLFEGKDNSTTYVIPNESSVVIGGTCQANDWNLNLSEKDRKHILSSCSSFVPEIQRSKIIKEWVGLRPARRGGVRLELEPRTGKPLVIHNYGHGGSGVTLFWGCALQVADMLSNAIQNKNLQSHL